MSEPNWKEIFEAASGQRDEATKNLQNLQIEFMLKCKEVEKLKKEIEELKSKNILPNGKDENHKDEDENHPDLFNLGQ